VASRRRLLDVSLSVQLAPNLIYDSHCYVLCIDGPYCHLPCSLSIIEGIRASQPMDRVLVVLVGGLQTKYIGESVKPWKPSSW
jgi:hypothetical protein